MRKLMMLFLSSSLLTVSTTSVVSCSKQLYFNDIWVITDGGTIKDKAFNQSSWYGANNFIEAPKDSTPETAGLGMPSYKSSYFENTGSAMSDLKKSYLSAVLCGAKTLILSGFRHQNNLTDAVNLANDVIYVDGANPNLNEKFKKLVAIRFSAESSGFLAGIISAAYSNAKHLKNNIIMTFGGNDNISAIDNYMAGYYVALGIWNYVLFNKLSLHSNQLSNFNVDKWYDLFNKISKHLSLNGDLSIDSIVRIGVSQGLPGKESLDKKGQFNLNDKNSNYFSNSFDIGKAIPISQQFVSDGASVIMPVAGAQVQDVINVFSQKKVIGAKVIGVDTDNALQYNNSKSNYVLTSALKNISGAVRDCLYNIYLGDKSWLGKTKDSGQYKFWNGLAYKGGPGMDDTNGIDSYINSLLTDENSPVDQFIYQKLIPWYNANVVNKEKNPELNWSGVIKILNNDVINKIINF